MHGVRVSVGSVPCLVYELIWSEDKDELYQT